jgi:hypothetical protein
MSVTAATFDKGHNGYAPCQSLIILALAWEISKEIYQKKGFRTFGVPIKLDIWLQVKN